MRIPAAALCILLSFVCTHARNWPGIKSKFVPVKSDSAEPVAPVKPKTDTVIISRKIQALPVNVNGVYFGTLEGVRCFNCSPETVLLNVGDSVSSESSILELRIDVWNAIERPLKDRRIFDYDNRCFYFGHKDVDTALVGREWTEIRTQEIPCFPYLKRIVNPGGTVRARALSFPAAKVAGDSTSALPQAALGEGE